MDRSGEESLHDDRVTEGGCRRRGLSGIVGDRLRNGRNAAGPEDRFGEVFIEGSRFRIDETLQVGGHRRALSGFTGQGFRPTMSAQDHGQAFRGAGYFRKGGNSVNQGLLLKRMGIVPPADDPRHERFAGAPDTGGEIGDV